MVMDGKNLSVYRKWRLRNGGRGLSKGMQKVGNSFSQTIQIALRPRSLKNWVVWNQESTETCVYPRSPLEQLCLFISLESLLSDFSISSCF